LETHMKTFVEYLPLVALLSPVLVLAAVNIWLRLSGEEGTLLFPSAGAYPEVEVNAARFAPDRTPEPECEELVEEFRKAA